MMLQKKDAPVVAIALLLALTNAPKTSAASWNFLSVGTSTNLATFPLPTNVPDGTAVKIAGSSSMAAISQALKQGFEGKFPGSAIASETTDANTAIKQLLDGQVDLAAISRPLTADEKAAGLVDVPVSRDKIAVVVSPQNPYAGELTHDQFAKIFRGEITDWSQIGGQPGTIRLIDRPESSDLRQSFKGYPVFEGNFATGTTAVAPPQDSTDAMVKLLGTDGIGYATAKQVLDNPNVRVISMWGTPPTDPRYPFSQPFAYVYKGQNPSPAVQAFLGYASAPEAQPAIEQAKTVATPPVGNTPPSPASPSPSAAASPSPTAAASPSAAASPGATASPAAKPSAGAASPGATALAPGAEPAADTGFNMPSWIWWLLPLGLLALLLGWLFGDRRTEEDPELTAEGGVLPDNDNYTANTGLAAGTLAAGGAALDYSRGDDNGIENLSSLSEGGDLGDSEGNMFSGLWGGASDTAEGAIDGVGNAARSGGDALSGLFGDASDATGNALDAGGDALSNLFGGASDMAGNVMNAGGGATPSGYLEERAGAGAMAAGAAAAAGSAFSGGAPAAATPSTGTNRIVLVPREPHRAHVYWEIPNAYKEAIRQRGGEKLALRLYDVTGLDLSYQTPHSVQQFDCGELARDQDIPVSESDRDYIAEIGYLTADQRWLRMARSATVRVPSVEGF
jgi:phosphate transport system substrate-binding protein